MELKLVHKNHERCRRILQQRWQILMPISFENIQQLAYFLESTNPCPINVHMEPFSTSVFKY